MGVSIHQLPGPPTPGRGLADPFLLPALLVGLDVQVTPVG
jgi:hypothetical protein